MKVVHSIVHFQVNFYINMILGNITSLVLRSRLHLSELVASRLFVIVFQLYYVISEEFAKPVVIDNVSDPNVKKKRVGNFLSCR